jgi:hypothetical protein
MNTKKTTTYWIAALLFFSVFLSQLVQAGQRVTVDNFARAETDRTMQAYVDLGGFGKFYHTRLP